jgi:hypothetical protein
MQRIGVVTFPGFHVMTLAAMSVFEVANSELRCSFPVRERRTSEVIGRVRGRDRAVRESPV